MKRIIYASLIVMLTFAACVNDDKYDWNDDFADRTETDTLNISIAYSENSVTVTGDEKGYVSISGSDVTVRSNSNRFLLLTLSGSTTDGSLLIYSWKKFGLLLNGVSIRNADGPAINNQCNKALYIITAENTVNTLSDTISYAPAPVNSNGAAIDQKGTLFSEGQIYFQGKGTLNIRGNVKNGIASDDYIIIESGTLNVNVSATGSNGIKVKDGFSISGGTLQIDVKAKGARGIKCDSYTTVSGGETTISTWGDCLIDSIQITNDSISCDTVSCAAIKSDSLFVMTAGKLELRSAGDGGKGLNCSQNIEIRGGEFIATTAGNNKIGKPKAVKSETGIILSGGYFFARVSKSWACDNGSDSDDPEDRVTVIGEPKYPPTVFGKKNTIVAF